MTIFATISGTCTTDLVVKTGSAGKPYCNFSLAHEAKGGHEFVSVICFGDLAEWLVASSGDGRMMTIQGELQQSEWTDRSGRTRHGLSITASHVERILHPHRQREPAGALQATGDGETPPKPRKQRKPRQPRRHEVLAHDGAAVPDFDDEIPL